MAAKKKTGSGKTIETFTHDDASRLNIPTVELSSVAQKNDLAPVRVAYERRNRDLDPQLIWREKYGDEAGDEDLMVRAAPLYIQEKVHPKALIDDLKKETESRAGKKPAAPEQLSLFADFNGIPEGADKTEFYQHEQNWSNRMILGDSLQVMAGLAEREGLRGKVQCIYFDPPYGIKFNSNFQWSTTSRDVKDNKADHITREPEQVKAFRDTWKDGIHSYLTYLRDRLIAARDLLTESGSIFVQIGDENVHRVRAVMDEVFGDESSIAIIHFNKTGLQASRFISSSYDYILWYGKSKLQTKYRPVFRKKVAGEVGATGYLYIQENDGSIRSLSPEEKRNPKFTEPYGDIFDGTPLTSSGSSQESYSILWRNNDFSLPSNAHWKTTKDGFNLDSRNA